VRSEKNGKKHTRFEKKTEKNMFGKSRKKTRSKKSRKKHTRSEKKTEKNIFGKNRYLHQNIGILQIQTYKALYNPQPCTGIDISTPIPCPTLVAIPPCLH
jgi:hypothetical protein